jgi:hypothetical protein
LGHAESRSERQPEHQAESALHGDGENENVLGINETGRQGAKKREEETIDIG